MISAILISVMIVLFYLWLSAAWYAKALPDLRNESRTRGIIRRSVDAILWPGFYIIIRFIP